MELVVPSLLAGVAIGLLYGLLAFSIVLLYKATGIFNFAQGNMATVCAFVVYLLYARAGVSLVLSLVCGFAAAAVIGVLVYVCAIRPNDHASDLNLVVRTVAVFLLASALLDRFVGQGQPFPFPSTLPSGSVKVSGTVIAISTIGIVIVSAVLLAIFASIFLYTRYGLVMRATATRPDIAALLGVNVRKMAVGIWILASIVGFIAAVLTAPTALLSTSLMELSLPLAFTGAVLGGLDSLTGSIIGGVCVGVLTSFVSVYVDSETALYSAFGLLLLVLLVRPQGLLGGRALERL